MDRKIKLRAFTLIELMVVISILSILIGIAVISYNSYSKSRDLENDVYKIFALATKARTSAFTDKENNYVYLSADGFEIVIDNNTNSNDGVKERVKLNKKFLSDNSSYLFDKNGFLKSTGKIYPEEIVDVQFNCVKFSDMVYLGKMNGGNCDAK
ncbi:MAG: prepilin-type N-terminal cleavage/methylation domain-containing protein [Calditerrivibrio sp.]|nr:prepilin-type N-terminal cleavage/methylation domain-containing protein [Calditerrivibrio sp.]